MANQSIPEIGFLRLTQIIGNPSEGIPPLIPVKRSTWWKGVKDGTYPRSYKLSPQVTVWKVEDIRHYIDSVSESHLAN